MMKLIRQLIVNRMSKNTNLMSKNIVTKAILQELFYSENIIFILMKKNNFTGNAPLLR